MEVYVRPGLVIGGTAPLPPTGGTRHLERYATFVSADKNRKCVRLPTQTSSGNGRKMCYLLPQAILLCAAALVVTRWARLMCRRDNGQAFHRANAFFQRFYFAPGSAALDCAEEARLRRRETARSLSSSASCFSVRTGHVGEARRTESEVSGAADVYRHVGRVAFLISCHSG